MGLITGAKDYSRFLKGEKLTRQEAIDAQCYICNGKESVDCKAAKSCTLYRWSPFRVPDAQEKAEAKEKARHLWGKKVSAQGYAKKKASFFPKPIL